MNVTFDLFSALLDSRSGAAPVFEAIASREGWPVDGDELYAAWDRRHKALQARCRVWRPITELGREALAEVLTERELGGDLAAAMTQLWDSLPDWPLWPDSEQGVRALAPSFGVGLLSNVDDALLARTRARTLPVAAELVVTSESVRAYKPSAAIYAAARSLAGPAHVHVASSARDVRGALEAGLDTVRLVRPGHTVDPAGPRPDVEVGGMAELVEHLQESLRRAASQES